MPTSSLLFLQLPRLDHDVTSPGENVMLAAACLGNALAHAPEGRHWRVLPPLAVQDQADNRALVEALCSSPVTAVGATLYLWNVERTLRVLSAVRRRRPDLRVVVGGPEVARDHPFLLRHAALDAAVVGEGEMALPLVLRAFRTGHAPPSCRAIGWRPARGGRLAWGERPLPVCPLARLLPPPTHPINRPDANGMAYLETNRGCPLRCAFCCYNLRRRGWSSLPPAAVARRVTVLRRRGAREIRLVDPTFNAHPQFHAVLDALRRANPGRRAALFVEVRAETVTETDARALAAAGVREAEVGVQSTDPAVLRRIRRPTDLSAVERGIRRLEAHGIRTTIDFMLGLPGQRADDVERALAWFRRHPRAHPQMLPTLLLPGTELRDRRHALGLRAQSRPPYRVRATRTLSARAIAALEAMLAERLGGFDAPTRRFVGRSLPDLFADRMTLDAAALPPPASLPAGTNRRTVIFRGRDLFARREVIADWIARTVALDRDILWQFVLAPAGEEPLDLLEYLLGTLRRLPPHWLDRMVSPADAHRLVAHRLVARRLFVRLPRRPSIDPAWAAEAESLLLAAMH